MEANVAELLAKAQKPNEDAMRLHPLYRGKLEVTPKCAIRSCDDFSVWYTPGVAAPCRDIAQHPERVFTHTAKRRSVGLKAIEQGVARKVRTKNQLIDEASKIIGRAQRQTKTLMEHGVIAAAD